MTESTGFASDLSVIVADMDAVRARTLALVEHIDAEGLERQVTPILSPLVWDLGHIAAFEDLWLVHRHAGEPLLRPELAAVYDAQSTPRPARSNAPLLGADEVFDYMAAVRERVLRAIERRGVDPYLHEMVLRHELQHTETMRQAMALADLLPAGEPPLRTVPADGPEWIEVPEGEFAMGADGTGYAYDNELPRHVVALDAYRIARRPVTNAQYREFVADGGYRRRELWSAAGWEWLRAERIEPPAGASDGHPDAPVCHVSFHEAQAFARWRGARLPTEAEWERAARAAAGNEYPWGPTFEEWREGYAAVRGVISRVRSFQKDKNEWGLFDMVGNVQELTSTRRDGRIVVKGGSIATARDQAGASAVKLVKPGEEVSPTIGLRVLAVERAP